LFERPALPVAAPNRGARSARNLLRPPAPFTGKTRPPFSSPVPDYVASLEGGVRGLRVGIDEAYAFDGLSEEVIEALSAARDALVALGARLIPIDFPSTADAVTAWGHLCLVETAIAHEATYPSRAAEYGPGLGGFLPAQAVSAQWTLARLRSCAANSLARWQTYSRTSM
jgi:amidase